MQKAYIRTFGCQMNEQDSAQMFGLLAKKGYERTEIPLDADMILLNTCSVREKPVQKIYSEMGRLRPLKRAKPDLIIGIAGCVAEQEKGRLAERFPFVDLIFGPDQLRRLPQMIEEVLDQRKAARSGVVHRTGFDARGDFEFVDVLPVMTDTPVKAYVNIQKGCDNICSFCIVPFVRGREVSRPHEEIISEILALVARGVKEVTLLGQNVNAYGLKGHNTVGFAKLLELIAQNTPLKRLRFTTSHPKDVREDLIEQFANNPILAPQLHLPVQSGSDRILQLMRRHYTAADYLLLIDKLKRARPEIRFSSDLIVGFPTETENEFEETLALMQEVCFDQTFSFVYSPRPMTKACELEDDIPRTVKSERLKKLQALDKKITLQKNNDEVGMVHEVLTEGHNKEGSLYPLMGRTATNKIVHFKGDVPVGDFVQVKIVKSNPHSLYGETLKA